MNWVALGRQGVLIKLGIANSHPLMRGVKVDVDPEETDAPPKPPVPRVWPPPPHATSGATLNPKVASKG